MAAPGTSQSGSLSYNAPGNVREQVGIKGQWFVKMSIGVVELVGVHVPEEICAIRVQAITREEIHKSPRGRILS